MSNNTLFLSCPRCNEMFIPKNDAQIWCSMTCKKANQKQKQKLGLTNQVVKGEFSKDCPTCLMPFVAFNAAQIYCTRQCKQIATQARARGQATMEYRQQPSPIYFITCAGCETLFTARMNYQKFCSPYCKSHYQQAKVRQRRQKLDETTKGFKQKIFFRDEGLCGICKHPVDISLKYPDQMSMSIDHIIPLAKGGAHAMHNLQIAHWICNIQKSDN